MELQPSGTPIQCELQTRLIPKQDPRPDLRRLRRPRGGRGAHPARGDGERPRHGRHHRQPAETDGPRVERGGGGGAEGRGRGQGGGQGRCGCEGEVMGWSDARWSLAPLSPATARCWIGETGGDPPRGRECLSAELRMVVGGSSTLSLRAEGEGRAMAAGQLKTTAASRLRCSMTGTSHWSLAKQVRNPASPRRGREETRRAEVGKLRGGIEGFSHYVWRTGKG